MDHVEEEKKRPAFINYRRIVYHRSWDIVVRSIIDSAIAGMSIEDGNRIRRVLYLLIQILSGDFEEL